MRNDLNKHKKSDKIKWTLTAVAFVLFAVLLAGVCLQVFGSGKAKPSEWLKKADTPQAEQTAPETKASFTNNPLLTVSSSVTNSDIQLLSSSWQSVGSQGFSATITCGGVPLLEFGNFMNTCMKMEWYRDGDTHYMRILVVVTNDFSKYSEFADIMNTYTNFSFSFNDSTFSYGNYTWDNGVLTVTSRVYSMVNDKLTSCPMSIYNVSQEVTITCEKRALPLPEEPQKEGYTFNGWYKGNHVGTEIVCGGSCERYTETGIYEDTVLHAHFAINEYTVTYDSAGGTAVNNATVNWNTVAPLPSPTRTGYNFMGWFLVDGTEYKNQPITEDITLTAHWEIKTFTVTFYVGGEKYSEKVVQWGDRFGKIEEQASAQNLQVTALCMSSGAPITDLTKFAVTENIEVQAEIMTGADKVQNTIKNNWLTIALSVGGVIVLVVLISTLFSRKKKKAYRY